MQPMGLIWWLLVALGCGLVRGGLDELPVNWRWRVGRSRWERWADSRTGRRVTLALGCALVGLALARLQLW